jgi:predicted SAM-dependent methyltransferase
MSRRLILEIGCGDKKVFENSIGLDIRKTPAVDIVADARKLPFPDNRFDHVFSSHIIEHFSHTVIQEVLSEWVRVLKPGGIFELRCPDLQARALLYCLRPNWQNVINIYGEQDYPENTHKCGFSYGLLKQSLEEASIINIKRIYKGYMGIPFLPDCLHIKGTKVSTYR